MDVVRKKDFIDLSTVEETEHYVASRGVVDLVVIVVVLTENQVNLDILVIVSVVYNEDKKVFCENKMVAEKELANMLDNDVDYYWDPFLEGNCEKSNKRVEYLITKDGCVKE